MLLTLCSVSFTFTLEDTGCLVSGAVHSVFEQRATFDGTCKHQSVTSSHLERLLAKANILEPVVIILIYILFHHVVYIFGSDLRRTCLHICPVNSIVGPEC